MMNVRDTRRGVFAAFSCAVIAGSSLFSQSTDSISVDHPRPLAEVLNVFQDRYKYAITYEDPAFGPADVVDVTDVVRKPGTGASSSLRILGPRGGRFTVTFVRPEATQPLSEVKDLVEGIVSTYNASGFPGQFRVIQADGLVHVAPVTSVLDAPVSLPAEKGRDAAKALRSVFAAIARASGEQFVLGTVPQNLLLQTSVEGAMPNGPARDTLAGILRLTGRRLSWRLLYSRDQSLYAFNVRILE